MEPKEQPTEPGWYWATGRAFYEDAYRMIVEVEQTENGLYVIFGCDEYETSEFTDYCGPLIDPLAEAVDPLAIKCGWYWANRVGQSNWRQVVRVVEHCDNYGDDPRLVVATAGSDKVYELTDFEQFDPLAETPK